VRELYLKKVRSLFDEHKRGFNFLDYFIKRGYIIYNNFFRGEIYEGFKVLLYGRLSILQ
jgi:hypothetical protein